MPAEKFSEHDKAAGMGSESEIQKQHQSGAGLVSRSDGEHTVSGLRGILRTR